MPVKQAAFWSIGAGQHLRSLRSSEQGLTSGEALKRLERDGYNQLNYRKPHSTLVLLLGQFKSAIVLLLLLATALSFYLDDHIDAIIILTIVLISSLLGFWQEKGAVDAVEKLLAMVEIKIDVWRDRQLIELAASELVAGDVISLSAGSIIPADCLLLTADNLFVDEAALTGESYPAEKMPGVLPVDTELSQRSNALWMGTHVQSGKATALVVATAQHSQFGALSAHVKARPPETEFERGVSRFGYLLMEVTLILVVMIFAVNVYLHKPVMESFLFALALAVGLTPQLLPAVISVNLAHGARRMAEAKVIVKQLASIENLGSMNVLCSDKTGTLTEGTVVLEGCFDVTGQSSQRVARLAYLNACYETGFNNPIDSAIRQDQSFDLSHTRKLDEIPYDFYRKRLSMAVEDRQQRLMVSKGALKNMLAVCSEVEYADGRIMPVATLREQLLQQYQAYSEQGLRTLGVAYKPLRADQSHIAQTDEQELRFVGFMTFLDPPKADCSATIEQLRQLGVTLKIITGDNRLVAETVSRRLGLEVGNILTGPEISQLSSQALINRVATVNLFAEVEPNQKEQIVSALRKAGFVVGYMGDGINDISALHAADVGISVDSAADVAKDTAQIVLQEKSLQVLVAGVKHGRITFANTLKYVFMATSANFGNMFSMAGVSLFLPFLPLLPKQILLTNLLTDFPEMTIASDHLDAEMIARPRRWNIQFIRRFMMVFGLISSLFDYLTFGVLLYLQVPVEEFRTAWFVESVISAAMIVFVVRSRQPFFRSKPSRLLLMATLLVVMVTGLLPYTPVAGLIGFVALPPALLAVIGLIIALYMLTAELAKKWFYRWVAD